MTWFILVVIGLWALAVVYCAVMAVEEWHAWRLERKERRFFERGIE